MATKGGWQEFGSASSAASLARPAAASPVTPRAQQQIRVQGTKAGKDGVIELRGDQVAAALAALEQAGFRSKQAGG
jgi:translation initiation factor 1